MALKRKFVPKREKTSFPESWRRLHDAALASYRHSYAPYSSFPVGAAIETEDGSVYGGCNVENASYGGSICAERVAICKAVSEGATRVKRVLVLTPQKALVPPCGFCLQFISEFGSEKTEIGLGDLKELKSVGTMAEYLPNRFGSSHLAK